jgi:type 1 fimbria pilin
MMICVSAGDNMLEFSSKLLIAICIVSSWHINATAACVGTTAMLTMDLGTIAIDPGNMVAVGSVIKTLEGKWTSFGANSPGNCGTQTLIAYQPMPGAVSAGFSNAYDTNLTGVGIRVSVWAIGGMTYGIGGGYYGMPATATPVPYQLPIQNLTGAALYGEGYNQIRVELIRTATDVQGGVLQMSGPLLIISDQTGQSSPLTLTNLTVKATSSLSSCSVTTPHLIVDMGAVRMPDVVAQTPAAAKSFTIELTCSAMPNVSIQFDGLTVAGNQKALQLRDGPGVATGIGLQILDSSSNPLTFGQMTPLATNAPTGVNKFNFSARYVPIAPHRTPGTADANATFTMEYN